MLLAAGEPTLFAHGAAVASWAAAVGGAEAASAALRMALGRSLTCSNASGYFGVKTRRNDDAGVQRSLGSLGGTDKEVSRWYCMPKGSDAALAGRAADILLMLMRRFRLALGCVR